MLPLPTISVAADVGLSPLGWLTAPGRLNSASEAAEDIVEGAGDEFSQRKPPPNKWPKSAVSFPSSTSSGSQSLRDTDTGALASDGEILWDSSHTDLTIHAISLCSYPGASGHL